LKKSGWFLVLYLTAFNLAAQTLISGRVFNGKTNEGLAGANIFLEGTAHGGMSDSDGRFEFSPNGLPDGKYTFIVNYMGYHDYFQEIDLTAGNTVSLDIPLKESLLYMDQIVVTGTRTERILKDTPVTTQIVKGKKITESGTSNISELLSEVTGISVDQDARFGKGIDLQGFDSNHILLMIDGMKVIGRLNGQLDISQFPVSQIDRIEIVKGAVSALYGSQAMGGVVNIITKKQLDQAQISADVKTGAYNRLDGQVSFGMPLQNWSPRITLGTRRFGGYDLNKDTPLEDGRNFVKYNADLNISGRLNDNIGLKLQGAYFEEEQRRILNDFFEEKTDNDRTSIRVQTDVKSLFSMSAQAGIEYSRYSHVYGEIVRSSGYFKQGETAVDELSRGDLLLGKQFGDHALNIGFSSELEKIESGRVDDNNRSASLNNIFIQDEYKPLSWLSILAGGRYDMHSIYGDQFSPKISVMLIPKHNRRIRLSYGRGFRAPDFKELYLTLYVSDVNLRVTGNPDLKPETSNAVNLDYEVWNDHNYHMNFNVFYNKITDLIEDIRLDSNDGSLNYTYTNFAAAKTWGGEWDMRYFPKDWLEVSLGYRYLDSWEETTGEAVSGKPKHQGHAGAIFSLPYNININTRLHYTGEKIDRLINDDTGEVSEKITVPDFSLIHINVSAGLPYGLRAYAGVRNLTDYVNTTWGPMPGREWYLGISYQY